MSAMHKDQTQNCSCYKVNLAVEAVTLFLCLTSSRPCSQGFTAVGRSCHFTNVCFVLSYRTYRRPRYKVAYKMVTEMEWRCCHGFSGEDCHNGPQGTPETGVSEQGHSTGGGQQGGEGEIQSDLIKMLLKISNIHNLEDFNEVIRSAQLHQS